MKRMTIKNTDLEVSAMCCGSAGFGGDIRGQQLDAVLNAYRDGGGNFLDTAHVYAIWTDYGDGCSERALADYFGRNGGRDEMIIATKGGHPGSAGYRKVDRFLGPERINADLEDSLGRLDCDCIDLYWLHRDDTREPVGGVIDMLNEQVQSGRIRWFGASNWTVGRIAEANEYAQARNLQGFVASQPEWSLGKLNSIGDKTLHFFQDEEGLWHEKTQVAVIPYTPTAKGYFATEGRAGAERFENPTSRARLGRVKQLAGEMDCSTNQVALAYLRSHPFPVIPILGTSKPDHMADALAAAEIELSAEQVAWLREG